MYWQSQLLLVLVAAIAARCCIAAAAVDAAVCRVAVGDWDVTCRRVHALHAVAAAVAAFQQACLE
jgi:hypothetical protein